MRATKASRTTTNLNITTQSLDLVKCTPKCPCYSHNMKQGMDKSNFMTTNCIQQLLQCMKKCNISIDHTLCNQQPIRHIQCLFIACPDETEMESYLLARTRQSKQSYPRYSSMCNLFYILRSTQAQKWGKQQGACILCEDMLYLVQHLTYDVFLQLITLR